MASKLFTLSDGHVIDVTKLESISPVYECGNKEYYFCYYFSSRDYKRTKNSKNIELVNKERAHLIAVWDEAIKGV